MRTLRIFLGGLGTGALLGLRLTPRVGKGTEKSAVPRIGDGVDQVADRANEDLKNCNQWENRLTLAMADFGTRLSALQELQERWALSFNESQRSIAADLRRLRVLAIWTVTMSCFGVVSFAIVLFLSYVKF